MCCILLKLVERILAQLAPKLVMWAMMLIASSGICCNKFLYACAVSSHFWRAFIILHWLPPDFSFNLNVIHVVTYFGRIWVSIIQFISALDVVWVSNVVCSLLIIETVWTLTVFSDEIFSGWERGEVTHRGSGSWEDLQYHPPSYEWLRSFSSGQSP